MATIKDVAAIAGVSFTTVSHVVNNTRPVSADVRSKVELAIRQLNYVPSAVARSLKARSTTTIGLVVPNSTNPYFAELARGIEDGCARNGYCLFFCNSDDDPAKQRNYLRVLQEKRIDGLIVASAGDDATLAKTLADSREPLVIVDRNIEGVSADLVQIDHEKGAYLATRHLLQLGHSKIGCITGPVETAVSAMRVHGFIRAMAERFFGQRRLPRGGTAVRHRAADRDFRGQRHDGHRRAARGGRARPARAAGRLGNRLRRHRTGALHVPGAVDGRPVGARARRNGGADAD
jgi:LacI family transcriptional regulator